MNANLAYEIKAEAFRLMTGHMAPGKDAASESYPAPFEERQKAWDEWTAKHGDVVRAMLIAVKRVAIDDEG